MIFFRRLCLLILLFGGHSTFCQIDVIADSRLILKSGSHTLKVPYYSSDPLDRVTFNITRAVIVVHGTNRNADDYFANMKTALAMRPEIMESTVIIAPQFLTEEDIVRHDLDEDHPYWSSDGWKSGSNSRNNSSNPRPTRIPSFEVLDTLVMQTIRSFPDLEYLVFTGHSAGGQLTNRYTASSPIFEIICMDHSISSKSIIANPGSYVYMSEKRAIPGSDFQYEKPFTDCSDYNKWSFGLEDLFEYPDRSGKAQILRWFEKREVVYLLGDQDIDPDDTLTSCRAKLQGAHRLERGLNYFHHILDHFGESDHEDHRMIIVPDVGHNNREMYTSEEGLSELFDRIPKNSCTDNTTATKEVDVDLFHVYPNPTTDYIIIENKYLKEEFNIQLMNSNGNLISEYYIQHSTQHKIDVSHLNPGIYLIKWNLFRAEGIKKIIVN